MIKTIQVLGVILFVSALTIFSAFTFLGHFEVSEEVVQHSLQDDQYKKIGKEVNEKVIGSYSSPIVLANKVRSIYNAQNDYYRSQKQWGNVMHEDVKELTARFLRNAAVGLFNEKKMLLFLLTFGLGVVGSLMYVVPTIWTLGPAGIKNNKIYQNVVTNKGWVAWIIFGYLILFYIILYWFPAYLINQILIVDPVKNLINGGEASRWFLYGFMYCVVMFVMGIKMFIKYRHNNYHKIRTVSVVFFQVVFAFLLVEILPLFNVPGVDLKNAWPLDYDFLFDWNVQNLMSNGNIGKFFFFWGILLSLILVPVFAYFFGKRWYCSWVCGCGGLAETLGDPFRQHSDKSLKAWKFERYLIHGVLVFAVIMTVWVGYHTYNVFHASEGQEAKSTLLGISAYNVRSWYGFFIGSIFAGVIGTGFYPIFGNRVWCRFGCPLAAYLGLVQRFKSRFRITTNGNQCISCGNCSTYCEQGIDVRWYAQRGQNIVRSSCVGCGVCAAVCPRGVLKLENGPEKGRINDDPIVIGNEGITLRTEN